MGTYELLIMWVVSMQKHNLRSKRHGFEPLLCHLLRPDSKQVIKLNYHIYKIGKITPLILGLFTYQRFRLVGCKDEG